MDECHHGLLIIVFLLQSNSLNSLYISDNIHSLHQVLSEFDVVRPIRTDSEGHFLSLSVSAFHRSRRHAYFSEDTPTSVNDVRGGRTTEFPHRDRRTGRSHSSEEAELYYNVTVFGRELHLRLHPNSRLVSPGATLEWEESGRLHSRPIGDGGCFYRGEVSNMADSSVALSSCDGLTGMIRTQGEEFFIQPLELRAHGGAGGAGGAGGRSHIIYRPTAIINQTAVNHTADDFLRGPLSGPLDLKVLQNQSGRTRRYIAEAELFNIEVLLAVDYSVLLFHGRENIQKYLLTLMNIVNEIYQDHSLGANINVVLGRIILLSPTESLELISVGNPQKSLEKVCGWSFVQQREPSLSQQHDLTIYLTRQEFGPSGMQGYAPVTGMCQLHRSCVLVLEDGFSSAFVAAHETGHVLGMEHDGEVNSCEDDVALGSIMSPRVQASFHRYHWSRCSWRELHQYLDTYDCLRDDPFNQDWPVQPLLPGFQYSMEQQCQFDFGPGYGLCTAYPTLDPCKQLWCSEYNNPFYCRTKKGPALDGTKCGPGKHCFKGFCMKLTLDLLRQDGGWGTWSLFGRCSRSCGGGVRFRTRHCDSPVPANGGRTCFGNSYEFQLCSQEACPPLTDYREDQCKVWNPFFEHDGQKHHWLPYQHPDPDERCRLYCESQETAVVVSMNRMVHDGTLCSYTDPHSVCVRGECEHVGCDGHIASDQQEDRCGVCGGDNSSCKIIKGNFTRSTKKAGYLKILEIPKEARHLLIQEFKGSPHVLAVRNQETGQLFLNPEDQLPRSRVVIEKGVAWEYNNTAEKESVQTTGPLRYGVLLMVRSHGDSKVTVSYKYIIQDRLRSSLESNQLQEDTVVYEWALKRWSHCSKPCGGGKQYTRFGCRRKSDGKMVHRMFCSNINKPRAISRNCNTDTCSMPRWVTGNWQDCSASCGQTGWQRRWVSCQQEPSRGQQQQQRSVHSKFCGDVRPDVKRTCNRFACPASWRAGPWTSCSVTCGNGTQERQVACSGPEGSTGNCSEPRPITARSCQAVPCSGDQRDTIIQWLSRSNVPAPKTSSRQRCRGDRSVFCQMEMLSRYCSIARYRQMCCKSCGGGNISGTDPPSNSSWTSTTAMTTHSSTWSGSRDITSTPPPSFTVTPPPTSRISTDFDYVEYKDYEEYSSYEDPSLSSLESPETTTSTTITTATTTATTTTATTFLGSSTTRQTRKTAPSHLFKKKTIAPPPATVSMVTVDVPLKMPTSAVPKFPTTTSPDRDDVITVISLEGRNDPTSSGVTGTQPPSLSSLTKTENNSVDEVTYHVLGLDGDTTRGQQNYFVPPMPPVNERTQNKRIQELLNEKRRQDIVMRAARRRSGRTKWKQSKS